MGTYLLFRLTIEITGMYRSLRPIPGEVRVYSSLPAHCRGLYTRGQKTLDLFISIPSFTAGRAWREQKPLWPACGPIQPHTTTGMKNIFFILFSFFSKYCTVRWSDDKKYMDIFSFFKVLLCQIVTRPPPIPKFPTEMLHFNLTVTLNWAKTY